MENASKALLMAGGILIALLVIGALLLMFNQISVYQKQNSSSEKEAQIAAFNQEFAKYADEDELKGTDIISLVNKIIDFNKKDGIGNSIDYDKKITLKVTFGEDFAKQYGTGGKLLVFKNVKQPYLIDANTNSSNNDFVAAINKFGELERKYSLSVMSVLSANYDTIKSGTKTIKELTGKNINITTEEIEQYREYSEFKTSTFIPDSKPTYTNEQITGLSFKYKK